MSEIYHIYCDESRQTKDRFMVLGGIIIRQSAVDVFNNTMLAYRKETKMPNELKWGKVNGCKYEAYKKFIDYFFALNNSDRVHFKCIIVDNHKVDHKKYSYGDKELSFYKFYYQLLLHKFGLKYFNKAKNTKFIIHPDHRESRHSLEEFKEILNKGMRKKLKDADITPFISIEPKKSHDCEMVQINDLLIGAVGYVKNDVHLIAGSSLGKINLCNYITTKAGFKSLSTDTGWMNTRFEIWNIRL